MIAVIGCGNMANAIVKGYRSQKNENTFLTFDPNFERARTLAGEVGGEAVEQLKQLEKASCFVIACKPQSFHKLCKDMEAQGVDLSQKHIISIMAAMPLDKIKSELRCKKVSRVMPNTPIFSGKGMSLLLHSQEVSSEEQSFVKDFFSACGEVADIKDEETFDKVTAVSGSGPAYVFLFAQTMAKQLQDWGLDQEQARKIVVQLFVGSSELMKEKSEVSLEDLIAQVTSKGGVTIEAVKTYKESRLEEITSKALINAEKRALSLVKELR